MPGRRGGAPIQPRVPNQPQSSWGQMALAGVQGAFMTPAMQQRMMEAAGTGVSPANVDSWIRSNWSYMGAFLSNPEIGPILRQAALEGWDEGRMYGAVQSTDWWRSTASTARQWDALVAEDPASAAAQAGQTAAAIQNRARSLGLSIDAGTIQELALTATRNGWTDAQTVDQLLQSVNWAAIDGGDLTALRDSVKQIGGQYLVSVSDATAQEYAVAIASGEMTEAGVQSIMQRQAKERFTWMADTIDQGITPSQYFAPVRDTIARELEMSADSIDMMDSKWLGMLEVPGEDGKPRAATLNEARMAARRQPEYAHTQGAQELASQAFSAIADVFGRRPI